jgi:large subunit ribosomal protein L10
MPPSRGKSAATQGKEGERLPLTRSEKQDVVAEVTDRLKKAQAIVVTDYRGLDVHQFETLRTKLRESGSEITVIKNSLLRRALVDAGMDTPDDLLAGPTAVAFLYDDISSPAKALRATVKDTEILTIKGGLMGGARLDASGVEALADLPSREELRATFLGVLQAPQRNLVTVMSAPLRDILGVLKARQTQQLEGASNV